MMKLLRFQNRIRPFHVVILLVIQCAVNVQGLRANEWVMERIGRKTLGVNWATPTEIGDGRWMFASDNGVIAVLTENNTTSLIDVGICTDLRCLAKVGTSLVVGASDGELLISADTGKSWRHLAMIGGDMTATLAVDNESFAVCTRNGIVSVINIVTGEQSVAFHDASEYFTCMDYYKSELTVFGLNGAMIHTTDMGESWERTQHILTEHDSVPSFTGCCRVDDTTLVIGAGLGQVFVSPDNGRTFRTQFQAKVYYGKLQGGNATDEINQLAYHDGTIYCTGPIFPRQPDQYFYVYSSSDFGSTWTFDKGAYPMDLWPPIALYFQSDGVGKLIGTDNGVSICAFGPADTSWNADTTIVLYVDSTVTYLGKELGTYQRSVEADTNGGNLYMLSRRYVEQLNTFLASKIYRSTNVGIDWIHVAEVPVNCMSMKIQDSTIVLGCDTGSVLISNDLGQTFSERIVVDTTVPWNTITVRGCTPAGKFALYSGFLRITDDVERRGWVFSIDKRQNIKAMPLPRDVADDQLTEPFVHGHSILAILHSVDTTRVVQSSHLVEWDTRTDQITSVDITGLLDAYVKYGAEIKYADDKYVWIATVGNMFLYDRSKSSGEIIPGLAISQPFQSTISTRQVIVDGGITLCQDQHDLYGSFSPMGMWSKVEPCGGVANSVIDIRDVVGLGNNRYFVLAQPYNNLLVAPTPSYVTHEFEANSSLSSIAISAGTVLTLPVVLPNTLYAVDARGKTIEVEAEEVSGGIQIHTTGLSTGLYGFVVGNTEKCIYVSVLITPR